MGLLPRGKNWDATFGEDFVPELGKPPHDGEDDAFPDQDAEHITRNLPAVHIRVQELVGCVERGSISTVEIKAGYINRDVR